MKPYILLASSLLVASVAYTQQSTTPKAFFENRLADRPDASPPPYDTLLRVVDSIGASSVGELQAILPLIRSALKSNVANLPIEGVFALFAIAQRPDGGKLLLGILPEIVSLTLHPDERISGGSVAILRNLTRTIPESSVPLLLNRLMAPGAPTLVKSEIVRSLLESSKRNDQQVLKSVEAYLTLDSEPRVKIATLGAITANRFKTPAIATYALSCLNDKDKHVQIAAIQAVYALGQDVRATAGPRISRLANDQTVDEQVRAVAERALQNRLEEPHKVELPPPPKR